MSVESIYLMVEERDDPFRPARKIVGVTYDENLSFEWYSKDSDYIKKVYKVGICNNMQEIDQNEW